MSTDLQTYTTLVNYSILSASAITTVNALNVYPSIGSVTPTGTYGNPAASYTGTINGTPDSVNATTAQTELTGLVGSINALSNNITPVIVGANITFTATSASNVYNPGTAILIGPTAIITFNGSSTDKFYIISTSTITLNDVASVVLNGGVDPCNIYWVAASAFSMTGTVPSNMYGIIIAQSTASFANGLILNGPVYAQTAAVTFAGSGSPSVYGCSPPICFVKGTKIMTTKGFVPIEYITPKDYVVTSGTIEKGMVSAAGLIKTPVMFVGHFSQYKVSNVSRPIVISQNAFGKNMPTEDVRVSPGHSIIVNNKMVLAKDLINNTTIYRDMMCESVEYYHIMAQNHCTLNASGLWSESLGGYSNRFSESMTRNVTYRNNVGMVKHKTYRVSK